MRTFSVVACALVPAVAMAVPMRLAHQGRVLDSAGDPLTGVHTVELRLYDVATGGADRWHELHTTTFDAGYFAVELGDTVPLDLDDFDGGPLYLALVIDSGGELPGRVPLSSVPYAFRAASLDGGTVDASEIAVGGTTVIASDGTIDWSHISGGPTSLDDLGCDPGDVPTFDGGWTCAPYVHDAGDVVSGVLDVSRLPVGTGSDEVAAGDHLHDAQDVASGVFSPARLPFGTGHDDVARGDHTHGASAIVSGTIGVARLPVGTTSGTVAAGDHTHAASDIVSGTLSVARLPVGTASGTVAAGDHTHTQLGTVEFTGPITSTNGNFSGYVHVGTTASATCDEQSEGQLRSRGSQPAVLEYCTGKRWVALFGPGRDCQELQARGMPSGTYTLTPDSGGSLTVYCDQDHWGGGWTKIVEYPSGSTTAPCGTAKSGIDLSGSRTSFGQSAGCIGTDALSALWDGTDLLAVDPLGDEVVFALTGTSTVKDAVLAHLRGTNTVAVSPAGTLTPKAGASVGSSLSFDIMVAPSVPIIGVWDTWFVVGEGGHFQNHGSNITGLCTGCPEHHTDVTLFVRRRADVP